MGTRECYGIDMKAMYRRPRAISEPLIISVDEGFIETETVCFKEIDIGRVKDRDLDFDAKFDLQARAGKEIRTRTVDALVVWFDCDFEGREKSVILSTSPMEPTTHWYSTVFLLPERWELESGEKVCVELNMARCPEN